MTEHCVMYKEWDTQGTDDQGKEGYLMPSMSFGLLTKPWCSLSREKHVKGWGIKMKTRMPDLCASDDYE